MRETAKEVNEALRAAKQWMQQWEKKMPKPVTGALRVWWIAQVPADAFRVPVSSLSEAKLLLKTFAAYDFYQLANHIKGDFSNAGGLEQFNGNDWEDWENPETGESIDDLL